MKKLSVFAIFLFGTLSHLFAGNVNLKLAAEVARNFYYAHNGITLNNNEISIENIITNDGDTTYYIFNYSNQKGFIILSADNATSPVIGYSFEGMYDKNDVPIQLEWLLDEYSAQIKSVKVQNKIQALPIHNEWTKLINKATISNKATVGPLTTTTWNQSPYYNDLCPYDSTAMKRTPAGCVAVALSQTLKYWNHPSQGKSSKSYTSDYGTLSANFENTTYNWSSMPNSITSANSEVAQLVYHAGISVGMDYGIVDGSSAFPSNIDDALRNYFRYASSTKFVTKTSYNDSTWEALIRTELNSKRVVIISATDSVTDKVGHAFVCDGYDGSTFHINWGWAGKLNGYFVLSNMVTWSYVWTKNLAAVVGIEPIASYCSSTKTISDSLGTITDGSGTNNYADNTDCKWLITKSSAKSITLTFKSLSTETNYDYVYVYDGSATTNTLLGKYSGTTLPAAITSSGNSMLIHFKSDGSVNKAGWEASYAMTFPTTTTTSACSGSTTLTSASGTFSDGSGSSNYTDNMDCQWLIQPSGASTITLTFSTFDLESGYDFVQVYDGSTTSATLLGKYSGSTLPSSVSSTGSSMLVYFTSDYSENAAGFTATYKGNSSSSTTTYATLPYSTSFESGLDKYWKTTSSSTAGRIQLTSSYTPYDGSKQLTMDVSTNGTYSTNEAWLRLNLSGVTQCYMTLYWKSFSDDTHTSDGIYFSSNGGTSFTKVNSYSTTKNSWVQLKLDIDQLAASAGLSLSSTFVIKLQQYDNYGISNDGMGYDLINVVSGSLKTSGIEEVATENEPIPVVIAPNPFSNSTTIYYTLNNNTTINIDIYNSLGQKVITLLNENKARGEYTIEWNGNDEKGNLLPEGIYTCVVNTEGGTISKAIALSR